MTDPWEIANRFVTAVEIAGIAYYVYLQRDKLLGRKGWTMRVEISDEIDATDGVTISAHSGGAGGSFANLVTLKGVDTDELVGKLKAVPGAVSVALKGAESDELVGTLAATRRDPPAVASVVADLLLWYLRVR